MYRDRGIGTRKMEMNSGTGGQEEGHRNRGRTDAQGRRHWNKERGIGTSRDETETKGKGQGQGQRDRDRGTGTEGQGQRDKDRGTRTDGWGHGRGRWIGTKTGTGTQ